MSSLTFLRSAAVAFTELPYGFALSFPSSSLELALARSRAEFFSTRIGQTSPLWQLAQESFRRRAFGFLQSCSRHFSSFASSSSAKQFSSFPPNYNMHPFQITDSQSLPFDILYTIIQFSSRSELRVWCLVGNWDLLNAAGRRLCSEVEVKEDSLGSFLERLVSL